MIVVSETYEVRIQQGDRGWSVHVVDAEGDVVFERACADEVEARTFASTVRQHIGWLSPERFRQYYRIGERA